MGWVGLWRSVGFAGSLQSIDNNRRLMRNGFVWCFSFGKPGGGCASAAQRIKTAFDGDARSGWGGTCLPTIIIYELARVIIVKSFVFNGKLCEMGFPGEAFETPRVIARQSSDGPRRGRWKPRNGLMDLEPFSLRRLGPGTHGAFDFLLLCLPGHPELVVYLQLQPEFGGGAEVTRQAKGRIGRDAAPSAHDLVEPGGIDGKRLGKLVGAQLQGHQHLLPDDLSRMDGRKKFRHTGLL